MCWNSQGLKDCAEQMFGDNFRNKSVVAMEEKISEIEYNFKQILEDLYASYDLDTAKLDNLLCNIADVLNLKVPANSPNVERKNRTLNELQFFLHKAV